MKKQSDNQSQFIIYQTENGETRLDVRFQDETVWLTQRLMSELFHTTPENILMHLKNIYREGELDEKATTKDFLVVRQEGTRQVSRRLKHYNLDGFLMLNDRNILQHAGKVSHQMAKQLAEQEYDAFNTQRLSDEAQQADEKLEALAQITKDMAKKND